MINTKTIIFFDFETGSLNADKTQPLELAAVAIDPRKLEVLESTLFYTKIKNLTDEEAIAAELDTITRAALEKNNIKLEDLEDAPSEGIASKMFAEWTYKFNIKKTKWEAPIAAGFNINNYDMRIMRRWGRMYGNKYGFADKNGDLKIFNPVQTIDLKDITFLCNENNPEIEANNFDAIRAYLGLTSEGSHSATVDVMQGATVLCKYMKLIRHWSSRTNFRG